MAQLLTLFLLTFQLLISSHGSVARTISKPGPNTASSPPPPPSRPLTGSAQEFLTAHNKARAAVGVAPLKWTTTLANAAAQVAKYQRVKYNCTFADLSSDKTKCGANQLWARGMVVSPKMAVDRWVGEKKFYNHGADTCAVNHQCGVYKQVVWRNSKELGCAQASCAKDGSTLTVCFYNPPGNIDGEKP